MAQSAQFQDVLTAYAQGTPNGWENFGAPGYAEAGGNPVAQFLGSFGWSASPTSGGVNFTLTNVTSFHSLMADHGPAYERNPTLPGTGIDAFPIGGPTPMGNVSQTITIRAVCH